MRSSKTGHKTSSVASVVRHVAPSCWNEMLPISSSSIHSTWPDNDRLAHFRIKMTQLCIWTKIRTKQWLVLGVSAFQFMLADFLCPKCDSFAYLYTHHDQNELHLNRWFFFLPISAKVMSQYFPALFGGRIKLFICQIRHKLNVTIHEISTSWKKNVRWRTQYNTFTNVGCIPISK